MDLRVLPNRDYVHGGIRRCILPDGTRPHIPSIFSTRRLGKPTSFYVISFNLYFKLSFAGLRQQQRRPRVLTRRYVCGATLVSSVSSLRALESLDRPCPRVRARRYSLVSALTTRKRLCEINTFRIYKYVNGAPSSMGNKVPPRIDLFNSHRLAHCSFPSAGQSLPLPRSSNSFTRASMDISNCSSTPLLVGDFTCIRAIARPEAATMIIRRVGAHWCTFDSSSNRSLLINNKLSDNWNAAAMVWSKYLLGSFDQPKSKNLH